MGARVLDYKIEPTFIDGLRLTRPKAVEDDRGRLIEFYRVSTAIEHGIYSEGEGWKQANAVTTKRGGLRGIHGEKMTKYILVVSGMIKSVHPDLRPGSATAGRVFTTSLGPGHGILVPPGVGNGFQAIEDTVYLYMFSQEWEPDMPRVDVNPLDPDLGIIWPTRPMRVSDKDKAAPSLAEALVKARTVFA